MGRAPSMPMAYVATGSSGSELGTGWNWMELDGTGTPSDVFRNVSVGLRVSRSDTNSLSH